MTDTRKAQLIEQYADTLATHESSHVDESDEEKFDRLVEQGYIPRPSNTGEA